MPRRRRSVSFSKTQSAPRVGDLRVDFNLACRALNLDERSQEAAWEWFTRITQQRCTPIALDEVRVCVYAAVCVAVFVDVCALL